MVKKSFDPFKNLKLDPYEQEIEDSIERGEWKPVKNLEKEKKRLQKIVAYTMALRKSRNINIRISELTLQKLKAKALEEGLPYQTLIGSILHKYAAK